MTDPRRDDPYAGLRSAGLLLAIPTLLIVSPLVGFFLGVWLDRWLGTRPWISLVGLLLGFGAGGYETYQIYRRYMAEQESEKRRGP